MWRAYQRLIPLQTGTRFCPSIAPLCPIHHAIRLPIHSASFATKSKRSTNGVTAESAPSSDAAVELPKKLPRKKRSSAAKSNNLTSPGEVAKLEVRAEELRGIIQRANDAYYSTAADKKPVELSDAQYDKLYKELQQIESSHPSLLTSTSPTLKPGAPSNLSQQQTTTTVSHLLPMLSLQSCTDLEDLKAWEVSVRKKLKKTATDKLSFNVELKYDGIAVSFLYEKGILQRVLTRGTGAVGEDITEAARRWVKSLPESIQLPVSSHTSLPADVAHIMKDGVIEVRGEILLTLSSQKVYANHLSKASSPEAGEAMLASPARNVTSGLLRRDLALDNANNLANKDTPAILDFVAYSLHLHHPSIQHVSPYIVPPQLLEDESNTPSMPQTKVFPIKQSESLTILQSLKLPIGLSQTFASKLCANLDEVISHISTISEHRDELDFAIDGIVIKVDDLSLAPQLGTTSHHPRGIMAFKFLAKTSTTKLVSIDWQIGRSGKIVPVANLEQILIDGVEVKRASLHNLATLQELDLKLGDTVQVERRGDVIPYIAGKVTEASSTAASSASSNDSSSTIIPIPTHCPCSLKTPLETRKSATDASRCDLFCVSANCPSQNMSKLVYYCSRDAMDIGGMAKSTIAELLEKQLLTGDLLSILELPSHKAEMLTRIDSGEWPGWGRKRVENLMTNIENAHARATPVQLLTALGIPRLGASVAKTMLDSFGGSLEAVLNATPEQLEQLPGLGEKTISLFVDQFAMVRKTLLPAWKNKGITLTSSSSATPVHTTAALTNATTTEVSDPAPAKKSKRKSTKK